MGKKDAAARNRQDSEGSVSPTRTSPPPGATRKHPKASKKSGGMSKLAGPAIKIGAVFVLPFVLAYIGYDIHQKFVFLPGLVSTPSDLPKILPPNHFGPSGPNPQKYWGTYRANNYFGMRTRSPNSPEIGLMWFEQSQETEIRIPKIRLFQCLFWLLVTFPLITITHWCDQGDGLGKYGWVEHDGESFGRQEIRDGPLLIETSFVKRPGGNHGGDWSARVVSVPLDDNAPPSKTAVHSFIVYIALPGGDKDESYIKPFMMGPQNMQYIDHINGYTPELGHFKLRFNYRKASNVIAKSYLGARMEPKLDMAHLNELILSGLGIIKLKNSQLNHYLGLMGTLPNLPPATKPTFLALQMTYLTATDFEIIFESASFTDRKLELTGDVYDQFLSERKEAFEEKFEKLFGLKEKQYPAVYKEMGHIALSNMLGGMGKWDKEQSLEILASWLDLMNIEGWIPREMILGDQAEAKVPEEYIVQRNSVANPPMFFYLFAKTLEDKEFANSHREFFQKVYPRIQLWYQWLNVSQSGPAPGTYRWRGRNGTTTRELNPKTLPSGLDDYPRASHPTNDEYHLDLFCWMGVSSQVMADIAELVGDATGQGHYKATADFLNDGKTLDSLYWSEKSGRYCDYGLHTKNVKLERPKPVLGPDGRPRPPANPDMYRVVMKDPQLRLVSDTLGYVSLFPLFLRKIPADSPKLERILKQINDPDQLWSRFGLRSLAKTSPLYDTRNTEHDPPYWRGSVWMNMNYLALASLHHYSSFDGPYRELAFETYGKLRGAVVSNVVREFQRTGFLWEHYNDQTGEGEGCHPFTGWTSLTLLMMAEQYD